jgi:transient receptor potential cation channel subfamily M protein 2
MNLSERGNGKISPEDKIGMIEFTPMTANLEQAIGIDPTVPDHVDRHLIDYITTTFNKRVCNRFVRSEKKSTQEISICFCGYEKSDHTEKAIEAKSEREWKETQDTETEPTDSYGEISFGGRNNSKYLRIETNTNVSSLLKLMVEYWNMEIPTLLISVTGGAQNFTMKPRLKEVFRHGLVKAAESTGAWIVTGGTNTGVMKHVGEAIRDYTIRHGSKNMISTIGIATWGCINNKDALVGSTEFGLWPADYTPDETSQEKTKETPLDPNHSHFLLVDNGTQHSFGA